MVNLKYDWLINENQWILLSSDKAFLIDLINVVTFSFNNIFSKILYYLKTYRIKNQYKLFGLLHRPQKGRRSILQTTLISYCSSSRNTIAGPPPQWTGNKNLQYHKPKLEGDKADAGSGWGDIVGHEVGDYTYCPHKHQFIKPHKS